MAKIYKKLWKNSEAMLAENRIRNLVGLISALFLAIGESIPIPRMRRGLAPLYTVIIICVIIAAGVIVIVLLVITPTTTTTTSVTVYP